MPLLLEQYNKDAETTLLRKVKDDLSADTSLVEIVDTETQTLLTIKVGSNDQEAIRNAAKAWQYAENRYVEPGKRFPKIGFEKVDSYHEICDGLLKLKSPILYRKAEHKNDEGYLTDSAALQTILDAAKKEVFANVRLAGCISSYSYAVKDIVYICVNVEFNKEPKAL